MGPCSESCDVCTGVSAADLADQAGLGRVKTVRSRSSRPVPTLGSTQATEGDQALFEALRSLRKELAESQRVPAYIVFSDKVLWEMAALRPATPDEMLEVSGVGPAKLERYGSAFLEILRQSPPSPLP
jgi:ATP-dependent DNA helicase RecQ